MKNLFIMAMMSLLPGCDWFNSSSMESSMSITKEERALESFDELKIAGQFDVTLTKGNEHKIIIEANQDVMPCVATQVQNGELNVYVSNPNITISAPIVVHVHYNKMNEIDIAGAVMLKADRLHAPQLDITASGASQISASIETDRLEVEGNGTSRFDLSGAAKKQKIDISGASVYNAGDLQSSEADVSASGSAHITLHAAKKILGELSGTALVSYKGSAKLDVKTTGAASISKVG
jgi:hypothetical protein